jgi:hypothetical protein
LAPKALVYYHTGNRSIEKKDAFEKYCHIGGGGIPLKDEAMIKICGYSV